MIVKLMNEWDKKRTRNDCLNLIYPVYNWTYAICFKILNECKVIMNLTPIIYNDKMLNFEFFVRNSFLIEAHTYYGVKYEVK